jgi:hypothetical protein
VGCRIAAIVYGHGNHVATPSLPSVGMAQSYFKYRFRHCAPPAGVARATAVGTSKNRGKAMEDDDFSELDDPAFLSERARVRGEIEALTVRYAALTVEFDRRASAVWKEESR